jgi:hypothetical protein
LLASGCTGGGAAPSRPTSGPSSPSGSTTGRAEWTEPGLVDPNGRAVTVRRPASSTGTVRDVVDYGADPAPGGPDDAPAIRRALAAAHPGDEVALPPGTFDLRSADPDDPTADLVLPSGVRLRGGGADSTVLRTSFDGEEDTAVVRGLGVEDVVVAGVTITSRHRGDLGTDPEDEGPGGGPMYGVQIGERGGIGSRLVLVEDVRVDRFQRHGITVKASREVTVTGCRVADATSVGPGGSGYGIAIEGRPGRSDAGVADDSRYNVVVDNQLDGTHLRHGILLQFATHNNLVSDNTIDGSILDAIDLHGEGEYLNDISGNRVTGAQQAAIALGNSGGAVNHHGASGTGNWVHGNLLDDDRVGVLVILGTPGTLIEDNRISGARESRAGIELRNAPRTVVRANTLSGASADFWAVRVVADKGDGEGAGVADRVTIVDNHASGAANGIRIDAGRRIDLIDNTVDVAGTPVQVSDGADVRRTRTED